MSSRFKVPAVLGTAAIVIFLLADAAFVGCVMLPEAQDLEPIGEDHLASGLWLSSGVMHTEKYEFALGSDRDGVAILVTDGGPIERKRLARIVEYRCEAFWTGRRWTAAGKYVLSGHQNSADPGSFHVVLDVHGTLLGIWNYY